MSKRRIADIDPNEFFIYKGKLYVCTGPSELKTFTAKSDVNVRVADKNWELYQPRQIPGLDGDSEAKKKETANANTFVAILIF